MSWTLAYRRKKHDLLLFHKILRGKCDLPLDMFCVLRRSVTRKGSQKISFPKVRLNCRYHFFSVRAGTSFPKISKKHGLPSSLLLFKDSPDNYLGPRKVFSVILVMHYIYSRLFVSFCNYLLTSFLCFEEW